jgi:hypothetical protein
VAKVWSISINVSFACAAPRVRIIDLPWWRLLPPMLDPIMATHHLPLAMARRY